MKILVAYDGSECAKAAIDDLQRAGLPADLEAVILTVADVWPHLVDQDRLPEDPLSNPAFHRLTQRARTEANQAMADAREISQCGARRVRELYAGWSVCAEAIAGSPALTLLTRADQLNTDLIVVGSHGRSAVVRALLGSVSQQVLYHAPCSVRVARGANLADDRADRSTKILIGVDGSVGAAAAVSAVAGRTWRAGSEARVVTAADFRVLLYMLGTGQAIDDHAGDVRPVEGSEDAHVRQMLNMVCDELRPSGLDVKSVLREGDPKHVLLQQASEWGADCIFVGAQGLSRMERFIFGSVSSSVAARAHCSVEVVRSGS